MDGLILNPTWSAVADSITNSELGASLLDASLKLVSKICVSAPNLPPAQLCAYSTFIHMKWDIDPERNRGLALVLWKARGIGSMVIRNTQSESSLWIYPTDDAPASDQDIDALYLWTIQRLTHPDLV